MARRDWRTWALSAGAPLLLGIGLSGCGGSSSGGGGFASTAAGSTPAATTSGTAPATSASNPNAIPQAPASQGVPLTVFNQELQQVWDKMRPQILGQLDTLAASKLAGQKYQSSAVEVEVRNVKLGSTTDMNVAPGLLRLDTQQIELRAPINGEWEVALEADLRVQVNIGSLSPAIDLPVTIRLEDFSLEVLAELDDSDPTRPELKRIGQPKIDFTLAIDSSNSIVAQLTGVLTKPADWLAQQAIRLVLNSLLPQLSSISGLPGAIPGDGAAPLVDSGVATPFEEVVENVELKLRQVNLPHGTILSALMDTPVNDTWLDAYRKGGPGLQGNVVGHGSGGDSAIWTGHYLAAEAFRYAVTQDPLALDSIGHVLKGIGALLDVNGGSGLLARNAAP
ncbi:MAG TPA: hypothetical protein DEA08_32085, partial [Planctomycetes bacterium]|nr:hypothetical protein [Planctomycetota bacterium]